MVSFRRGDPMNSDRLSGSHLSAIASAKADRWRQRGATRATPGEPLTLLLIAVSILTSVRYPKAKWIAGGVGAGLAGAALTNSCAMGSLLARLPYNRPASCDTGHTIERLRRHTSEEVAA